MRQQQVEQPFVDALLGLGLDELALLLLDQADADLRQVADHALDVAAVVADLGVFCRLDLEEGSADELREAAGDLGFADARRPDHDDVLRRDVFTQIGRQLLAAPAVANGDGDGALGGCLTDNVAVQFLHDLTRRHLSHNSPPRSH